MTCLAALQARCVSGGAWCGVVQITLDSLHAMFDNAKGIMQWLSLCAREVAKADKPVQWTTPLGLRVVQPYRKKVRAAPPPPPCTLLMLHATPQHACMDGPCAYVAFCSAHVSLGRS